MSRVSLIKIYKNLENIKNSQELMNHPDKYMAGAVDSSARSLL